MPTVSERFNLLKPDESFSFGHKKYTALCRYIRAAYSNKNNGMEPEIVEGTSESGPFKARCYPENFQSFMDYAIRKFIKQKQHNISSVPIKKATASAKLTIETTPAPVPKKERKRIPAKHSPKPLYSTRNYK